MAKFPSPFSATVPAVLLATLAAGPAESAILINPPRPTTDFELRVRLIQAQSNNGSVRAPALGNDTARKRIQDGVDQVFSQAGVEVRFESALVGFRNDAVLNGQLGFDAAFAAAGAAGALSPDSRTINVILVNGLPGTTVRETAPKGIASDRANGVLFYTSNFLLNTAFPTFQNNIAAVLSHELSHNIAGLAHSNSTDNLMRVPQTQTPSADDLARLTPAQVDEIRRNPAGLLRPRTAADFADFNGDGRVNTADYTTWRDTANGSGIHLAADATLDRRVDSADLAQWRRFYGSTTQNVIAAAVPEGAAAMSVGVGLLCSASACRRRGWVGGL